MEERLGFSTNGSEITGFLHAKWKIGSQLHAPHTQIHSKYIKSVITKTIKYGH